MDLAKLLLGPDKSIVFVVGRDSSPVEYRTEDQGLVSSIPLAILVDKNTASAAEVFAAALQVRTKFKLLEANTGHEHIMYDAMTGIAKHFKQFVDHYDLQ